MSIPVLRTDADRRTFVQREADTRRTEAFIKLTEQNQRFTPLERASHDGVLIGLEIIGTIETGGLATKALTKLGMGTKYIKPFSRLGNSKVGGFLRDQFIPQRVSVAGALSDGFAQFAQGRGSLEDRVYGVNLIGVAAEGTLGAFGGASVGGSLKYTLGGGFELPIYTQPLQSGVNIGFGAAGNYVGDYSINRMIKGYKGTGRIRGVGKFGVDYFGNQFGDQPSSAGSNAVNDATGDKDPKQP